MSDAESGSGKGEKREGFGRRRNITITFSQDEIDFYDQLMAELGSSLSSLARTALKLLVWLRQKVSNGVKIKFVYPDGSETVMEIFELESLGILTKRKPASTQGYGGAKEESLDASEK